MSANVVLGVGMSSKATSGEVRALVDAALSDRCLVLDDVVVVATRERFVSDERLAFGRPVVGIADATLEAASAPCERSFGLRARVAETAALLTASTRFPGHLVGAVERSAHVTVAVAASTNEAEPS
jgi:hypothetical protein